MACEFDSNGNLGASSGSPTHNIYIYGGTFALRYSYAHDPIQGQNFHIRAKQSTIEYNWFSRPKSYSGDLMTDDDFTGAGQQTMVLRGNLIDQGSPQNHGQMIAMYNDSGLSGLQLTVTMIDNTIVVTQPQGIAVHLSNADGTQMSVRMDNNLISGGSPYLIEQLSQGTVTGTTNWMPTGTPAGTLTGTVFGTNPFRNAGARDFTLAPGSTAIGAASQSASVLPDKEYFQNETVTRRYRARAAARDIGAFESTTTGPGIGPYGTAPASDGGTGGDGGSAQDGGDGGASGSIAQSSGCGCATSGLLSSALAPLFALVLLALRSRPNT